MKFISYRKGFTIIELMVVVAIIALLSGIIITSLTGSKAKSRDARRVSDVNQIQLALEQYFDRCGQYPNTITPANSNLTTVTNGCPSIGGVTISLASYISVIPKDPSSTVNSGNYDYAINPTYTDYILHAKLEGSNAAQQNSYPETSRSNNANLNGTNAWSNINVFHCYDSQTPPTLPSNPNDYCVSTK